MSALSAPAFQGPVQQCKNVTVQWSGGEFPVRVEAFYQETSNADWKSAGLTAEAATTNTITWLAAIPAGSTAWITLVDHTGTYKQTSNGSLVEDSDDASCLDSTKTASVITQTVFMAADGTGTSSSSSGARGLSRSSLLVVSVVFAVLFFLAAAACLYLFSLLRQSRRARAHGRGPRFSLEGDESESSFFVAPQTASAAAAAGAVGAGAAALGAKALLTDKYPASHADRGSRRASAFGSIPESPEITPVAAYYDDKQQVSHAGLQPASPRSTRTEFNPFLDPPLSAAGGATLRPSSTRSTMSSARSVSISSPDLLGNSAVAVQPVSNAGEDPQPQKPPFIKMHSTSDTLNSVQSMQLFNNTGPGGVGGLRVTNDPTLIPTPVLSRASTKQSEVTQSSNGTSPGSAPMSASDSNNSVWSRRAASEATEYPRSETDASLANQPFVSTLNPPLTSASGQRRAASQPWGTAASPAGAPRNEMEHIPSRNSISSYRSGTSASGSTNDHYASEPHSSRGYYSSRDLNTLRK